MADGLSGAPIAEEFRHFGETFLSRQSDNCEDDSPKVRNVSSSDHFSDAFEKSLAKGGKRCIVNIGRFVRFDSGYGFFLSNEL